jgi:hypothetical protein
MLGRELCEFGGPHAMVPCLALAPPLKSKAASVIKNILYSDISLLDLQPMTGSEVLEILIGFYICTFLLPPRANSIASIIANCQCSNYDRYYSSRLQSRSKQMHLPYELIPRQILHQKTSS